MCVCVWMGGGGVGREKEMELAQVRWSGMAVAHDLIHPEAGRTEERGKEVGGLVGWRRWGSPAAMDTQTQTQRKEVGNRLD